MTVYLKERLSAIVAAYENEVQDVALSDAIVAEIEKTHALVELGRWRRVHTVAKHAPDCEIDCMMQASYNCEAFDDAVAALLPEDLEVPS